MRRGACRLVVLNLIALLSGCSSGGTSSGGTSSAASSPSESATHVVVLGDSIATTTACPGCTGFPDLYGRAIARRTGSQVDVMNLAVPETGVVDLLSQVKGDSFTKQELADADVVVIMIGFNDTPWVRGDDPCHVAPNFPVVSWNQITAACIAKVTADYAERLDAVLTTVDGTAPEDSALRLVGDYNSVIGDHVDPSWDSPEAVAPSIQANAAFRRVQQGAAEAHGGVFVDMLKQINGPLGRRKAAKYLSADYTHLNQLGHKLVARALTQSGWRPT